MNAEGGGGKTGMKKKKPRRVSGAVRMKGYGGNPRRRPGAFTY